MHKEGYFWKFLKTSRNVPYIPGNEGPLDLKWSISGSTDYELKNTDVYLIFLGMLGPRT